MLQVNSRDGSLADTYLLQDEFVHASHNFGIHVWDDLLVAVGVSSCYTLQNMPMMGLLSSHVWDDFALVAGASSCHSLQQLLMMNSFTLIVYARIATAMSCDAAKAIL